MKKIRTAVLVSGGGTNLQALIDAEKRGECGSLSIELVISNVSGAYALERASQAGIRVSSITRRMYKENFETELLRELAKARIEMIILAGFLSILSEDFVRHYEGRIINVHPSLIPSFCGKGYYGLRVHEAALARGVKVTGATVHIVNEIPDGGRILMQKAVEVLPGDTPEVLQKRVMEEAEWVILPLAAEALAKELTKRHL